MVIYGINPVLEALQSSTSRVERIVVARGKHSGRIQDVIDQARSVGIAVHFEPIESLHRRAGGKGHQMVLAEIAEITFRSLDSILAEKPDRLLVLDGVEDPRNLGAVLRTAEAAGIHSILLPQRHTSGVTPTVVKTSAGAALHVKIAKIGNVAETLKRLKEEGFWTVGLDMQGTEGLGHVDPTSKLVLVVGGEDRGLRRLVRENCDFLVRLPMKGQVSSLNLSVAAGILFYLLIERESEVTSAVQSPD